MFDTKQKRSAALGFGLGFLTVLPVASGAISIEAAGQASAAYYYDLAAVDLPEAVEAMDVSAGVPHVVLTSLVLRTASASSVRARVPSVSSIRVEPDALS